LTSKASIALERELPFSKFVASRTVSGFTTYSQCRQPDRTATTVSTAFGLTASGADGAVRCVGERRSGDAERNLGLLGSAGLKRRANQCKKCDENRTHRENGSGVDEIETEHPEFERIRKPTEQCRFVSVFELIKARDDAVGLLPCPDVIEQAVQAQPARR